MQGVYGQSRGNEHAGKETHALHAYLVYISLMNTGNYLYFITYIIYYQLYNNEALVQEQPQAACPGSLPTSLKKYAL